MLNAPPANAGDCSNIRNPFRFICQSEPALLEAMNPTLKLPICGQENNKVIVQPAHLPSSAVFVTCIPAKIESCANIVKAMVQKKTGATINIIVPTHAMSDSHFIERVSDLTRMAQANNVPANIIPIEHGDKDDNQKGKGFNAYNRDPAIARSNGQKTEVVVLPSEQGESEVITKALKQCGDISVVEDVAKTENPNESAEGGNFLVLPNGSLLVGRSDGSRRKGSDKRVVQSVKDKFGENQTIVEIDLPGTMVGHIDEIFNIVPSKGKCGIAILSASPKAMKSFLEKNEKIEISSMQLDPDSRRKIDMKFDALRFKLYDEYKEIESRGETPPQELMERISKYWSEFERRSGYKNVTGNDLLTNKKIIDKWTEYQDDIEKAKAQLKTHLKIPTNCSDEDLFVDLPVLWDEYGRPQIANPVNGLYLNGNYFYSRQEKTLRTESEFDRKRVMFRSPEKTFPFPTLQSEVDRILKSRISADVIDVSTPHYNSPGFGSGGNLHCATMNIVLPCKPKK